MRWFNELQRVSASPEGAVRSSTESGKVDVRDRLPLVSTPTLVLHARGDVVVPFEEGRLLASGIQNARFKAEGPGGRIPGVRCPVGLTLRVPK